MKHKLYKFKNNFLYQTSKFIASYKTYLLVFFIVFLIAFITGIFTCSHYADSVTHENLINKYMISLLLKEITHIGFFLRLSLWFIIFALVAIIFTKNTILVVINGLWLAFLSYIWGFDICIIVLNFGLTGVIFGVIVLGILGLLIFATLILIISIATKRCINTKKFCDNNLPSFYIKIYIFLMVIGLLLIFVLSLFFSIIHIFVIVD